MAQAPEKVSPFDPERFTKAGLPTPDELRKKYGGKDGYTKLLADVNKSRDADEDAELALLRGKALLGGRYKLAKEIAGHGDKADIAKDDFARNRGTMERYEKLYTYFPWAYDRVIKERDEAREKGEDSGPLGFLHIDTVIRTGEEVAKANGVGRPKPKFKGDAPVIMIDPQAKTVESVALPAIFPGTKAMPPHWEPIIVPGGEPKNPVKLFGDIELYREVGGNSTGYYDFTLPRPYADTAKPKIVLKGETTRILITKVGKGKTLTEVPISIETLTQSVNFAARRPTQQDVFEIDPATGSVNRRSHADDEFVDDTTALVPLTDKLAADGLVMYAPEPTSMYAFTLNDQKFKGRAIIMRVDTDRWLVPLRLALSVGDLRSMMTFPTLEAIATANDEPAAVDPNAGFEELNDARVKELFSGIEFEDVSRILNNGDVRYPQRLIADGVIRETMIDGRHATLYHIEKVREAIAKHKEDLTTAEAAGLRTVTAAEFDVANADELGDLLRIGLGIDTSNWKGIAEECQKRDLVRTTGGKRLYHVERMKELIAKARADIAKKEIEPPAPEPDYTTLPLEDRLKWDRRLFDEALATVDEMQGYFADSGAAGDLLDDLERIETRLFKLSRHHDVLTEELAKFYADTKPSEITPELSAIVGDYAKPTADFYADTKPSEITPEVADIAAQYVKSDEPETGVQPEQTEAAPTAAEFPDPGPETSAKPARSKPTSDRKRADKSAGHG